MAEARPSLRGTHQTFANDGRGPATKRNAFRPGTRLRGREGASEMSRGLPNGCAREGELPQLLEGCQIPGVAMVRGAGVVSHRGVRRVTTW